MDIEKLIGLIVILNAIASVYASWRKKNKQAKAQNARKERASEPNVSKPTMASTPPTQLEEPQTVYLDHQGNDLRQKAQDSSPQPKPRQQRKNPALRSQQHSVKKTQEKAKSSTMSTHDWLEIISKELGLEVGSKKEEAPVSDNFPNNVPNDLQDSKTQGVELPSADVSFTSIENENQFSTVREATKKLDAKAKAVPVVDVPKRTSRRYTGASDIVQELRKKSSLKKAVVLKTVLDRPVSIQRFQ